MTEIRLRKSTATAVVVVGILLGSSVVVLSFGESGGGCSPGTVVAEVNDTLTPWLLLNSPFDGSAHGSVPIQNGSLNLTLFANNSGSVWGFFERESWTVRSGQSNGGADSSCSSVFFLSPKNEWSSDVLPLFNSSSPAYRNDSAEWDWVNITGTPGPIYFHNRFYESTSRLSTCGTNASVLTATSDHVSVYVQFMYKGMSNVVQTTIPVTTSYRYIFPANAGTWSIDNLSAPGGPGGGLAFAFLGSCA